MCQFRCHQMKHILKYTVCKISASQGPVDDCIPDLESLAEAKGLKVLYTCRISSDWVKCRATCVKLEYVCGRVDREDTSDIV